ncbi:MAG: hypothetical protein ACYDCL_09090 [Myxococcales bacterium]
MKLLCGLPVSLDGPLWPALPAAAGEAAVRFRLSGGTPRRAEGHQLFEGPSFEVAEAGGRLEIALWERGEGGVRVWAALDPAASTAEIRSLSDPASRRLRDEALPELVVAHLWPLHGVAYLHAAGTTRAGRARLFLGSSGAGKSTAAGCLAAAGDVPFCSDRAGVTAEWAAAAPWHGGSPSDGARAPVEALFALDRGGSRGVWPLPPGEALGCLAANAFLPRWWPAGLARALDVLGALAEALPVHRLCCEPDERLAGLVERACSKAAACATMG